MNRKIFAALAAVSTLAGATPALAQYSGGQAEYRDGSYTQGNFSTRIGQLQTRLQTGVQSGSITRAEAMPLRQRLRQLSQLERQYALNGFSGRERADLQQRMRTLRQQIRFADGSNAARWDRYDREDGYGRDGYREDYRDGAVGRDRDDDDDRDGRYGYDDGRDTDGRTYEDDRGYAEPQRGGLGGLLDTLTGGAALRVGQRAPGNLYGVPERFRDRFRDGNNSYYRADQRHIYEIDARNQTIVRVYAITR